MFARFELDLEIGITKGGLPRKLPSRMSGEIKAFKSFCSLLQLRGECTRSSDSRRRPKCSRHNDDGKFDETWVLLEKYHGQWAGEMSGIGHTRG